MKSTFYFSALFSDEHYSGNEFWLVISLVLVAIMVLGTILLHSKKWYENWRDQQILDNISVNNPTPPVVNFNTVSVNKPILPRKIVSVIAILMGLSLICILTQMETRFSLLHAVIYFDALYDFTIGFIIPALMLTFKQSYRAHVQDIFC